MGDKDRFIGRTLQDTYRIKRLLGKGGMGAVYEASHLRLPRCFAVKLLTSEVTEDSEALARFRREAEVTSALGHPHIVEVVDFNTTEDQEPYIVMELLEGEDLAARIKRCGRLGLPEATGIFKQAARALGSAHGRGIIHRDLKPPNIYICTDDEGRDFVKVVDFGISKVLGAQSRLTGTYQVLGTPLYMAPEQARETGAQVDHRVDVYAMGVILFEMLTGRPPFTGETLTGVLLKILEEPPPAIRSLRPELPEALEGVINRALEKDPVDRFASIKGLWQAVAAATGLEPPEEASSTGQRASFDPFGDTCAGPSVPETKPVSTADTVAAAEQEPPKQARSTLSANVGEVEERAPTGRRLPGSWIWGAMVLVALLGVLLGLYIRGGGPAGPPVPATVPPDGRRVTIPADTASMDAAPAADTTPAAPDVVDLAPGPETAPTRPRGPATTAPRLRPAAGPGVIRVGLWYDDGAITVGDVYLDGVPKGQTPVKLRGVQPGRHTVEIRKRGRTVVSKRVRVRPGRTAEVEARISR